MKASDWCLKFAILSQIWKAFWKSHETLLDHTDIQTAPGTPSYTSLIDAAVGNYITELHEAPLCPRFSPDWNVNIRAARRLRPMGESSWVMDWTKTWHNAITLSIRTKSHGRWCASFMVIQVIVGKFVQANSKKIMETPLYCQGCFIGISRIVWDIHPQVPQLVKHDTARTIMIYFWKYSIIKFPFTYLYNHKWLHHSNHGGSGKIW